MSYIEQYLKALYPLVAGAALVAIDKLLVNDSIPDEVWLTLLGTATIVFGVPNTPRAVVKRRAARRK